MSWKIVSPLGARRRRVAGVSAKLQTLADGRRKMVLWISPGVLQIAAGGRCNLYYGADQLAGFAKLEPNPKGLLEVRGTERSLQVSVPAPTEAWKHEAPIERLDIVEQEEGHITFRLPAWACKADEAASPPPAKPGAAAPLAPAALLGREAQEAPPPAPAPAPAKTPPTPRPSPAPAPVSAPDFAPEGFTLDGAAYLKKKGYSFEKLDNDQFRVGGKRKTRQEVCDLINDYRKMAELAPIRPEQFT